MSVLPEGDDLVAEAWYDALDELILIINDSEDTEARVRACSVVLDYTSKFNIGLGENYIPKHRPVRSGGEDEDDED